MRFFHSNFTVRNLSDILLFPYPYIIFIYNERIYAPFFPLILANYELIKTFPKTSESSEIDAFNPASKPLLIHIEKWKIYNLYCSAVLICIQLRRPKQFFSHLLCTNLKNLYFNENYGLERMITGKVPPDWQFK